MSAISTAVVVGILTFVGGLARLYLQIDAA